MVVIHAGTNSLPHDDINNIANELFNIVKVCYDPSVKEVNRDCPLVVSTQPVHCTPEWSDKQNEYHR